MNIALFSDTYPPEINGVATSTYSLFKILKEKGNNVYVITSNPFSNKIEFKDDVLRMPGIELKKLYGYRISSFWSAKAMKIIRSMNLDIIHVQTDATLGIFGKLAAKSLKIPHVYTYHTMYEDYTYYATKGHFDRLAKRIVRTYSRRIAENCAEFITPSNKTKDILRSYGADCYVNVVPTGINFSLFRPDMQDKIRQVEFKKKHGIDNDTFILLSLGRVAKEKSIDVCLKGYAKFLKTAKHKTKMLIVGDGPARVSLELLASDLKISNHVLFLGAVPGHDVAFYYALANVFVSASITETQGLTYMEAMASHRLILARYDDNLVNVVKDNVTGFFFENEEDFGEKLQRLITLDSRKIEEMTVQALELVKSFSIETFYEKIMEVYIRAIRKFW